MWELKEPKPVKLIIGILAANQDCLEAAVDVLTSEFGKADLISDVWPFDQTDYYNKEIQVSDNPKNQTIIIDTTGFDAEGIDLFTC